MTEFAPHEPEDQWINLILRYGGVRTESFGGMYFESGAVVVAFTQNAEGHARAIEKEGRRLGLPPIPVRGAAVKFSESHLSQVIQAITDEMPNLEASGVQGVGMDTQANAVIVFLETPDDDQIATLTERFGDAVRFEHCPTRPEPA